MQPLCLNHSSLIVAQPPLSATLTATASSIFLGRLPPSIYSRIFAFPIDKENLGSLADLLVFCLGRRPAEHFASQLVLIQKFAHGLLGARPNHATCARNCKERGGCHFSFIRSRTLFRNSSLITLVLRFLTLSRPRESKTYLKASTNVESVILKGVFFLSSFCIAIF